MKHGIHIKEHKNWNTKTIYNRGQPVRIYRYQPKQIYFRSPMVNDLNQHLCGGYRMPEIEDEDDTTIQQLLTKRKPFGAIMHWDKEGEEEKIRQLRDRLQASHLITDLRRRDTDVYGRNLGTAVWDLLVCQPIKVCDIGNLDDLHRDYAEVFQEGLEENTIDKYADLPLSHFFDEWDYPGIPFWLTGLILGYPIENTISIYKERSKPKLRKEKKMLTSEDYDKIEKMASYKLETDCEDYDNESWEDYRTLQAELIPKLLPLMNAMIEAGLITACCRDKDENWVSFEAGAAFDNGSIHLDCSDITASSMKMPNFTW